MNYRSVSVPVEATQWLQPGDHKRVKRNTNFSTDFYYLEDNLGNELSVEASDWIVEFPNLEIHVVKDVHFKQRFEHTEKYTPKELSYASRMAAAGDCV